MRYPSLDRGAKVFHLMDFNNKINPWSVENPNRGVTLPAGTYYYVIGNDPEGATERIAGFITLMR